MTPRRYLAFLIVLATACAANAAPTTTTTAIPAATTTIATTIPPSTTTTTTTTTVVPTTTRAPTAVAEDARAVILAGFPSTTIDADTAAFLAAGGRGIILYARNLVSKAQVAALTSEAACAAGAPIIVAVDQEPGRIHRLEAIGISAPDIGADDATFATAAAAMAVAMEAVGINLDLAPIVDVAQGSNPVLEGRNLGPDPTAVSERADMFIRALSASAVGTTAKHFPGHGLSRVDPHLEVTYIDAPLETLRTEHFPPFAAAIASGVSAVMVGHPIYPALDADNPASLSPAVLEMLRDEFGFDGVAMTDGLSMAALRKIRTIEEIAFEALKAGEDMLLADRPSDVPKLIDALIDAVAAGDLDRARLAEAATRVRRLANSLAPTVCLESG